MAFLKHTLMILSCLLVVACKPDKQQERVSEVICTYSILEDIVQNIAGDEIRVASIVPRLSDPHTFEPIPESFVVVEKAKIIFAHGLHFEGWLEKILKSHAGKVVYVASHHPARRVGQGLFDPHTWLNPSFMLTSIPIIVDSLTKAYPEKAHDFQVRGDIYQKKLKLLDKEIREELNSLPSHVKRIVLTTHDAFHYFGEHYGIEFIAPLGISTDAEPTPSAIQNMIDRIKKDDIRAIFIENLSNQKSVEQIVKETRVEIDGTLYADSLSKEGEPASTYLDMLRYNAHAIKKALLS